MKYEFVMDKSRSFATAFYEGKPIGTLQNDFLGNVNLARNSEQHEEPFHDVGQDFWDQFDAWAETQGIVHTVH